MPKTNYIELGPQKAPVRIPILYEDRSVIAIDKPGGWMLVPFSWQRTNWNLQAAITSSIAAGNFWARCRNLKFLRFVHRLDAETSGILLFAKTPGALDAYSDLFEQRRMEKVYLAIADGIPVKREWVCRLNLGPDPKRIGRIKVLPSGKEAETHFRVLQADDQTKRSLIESHPVTGRTHQIRVHLAESGHPVVGDPLYGAGGERKAGLALRAIRLEYRDPFTRKPVRIAAPTDWFLEEYGFPPVTFENTAR